MIYCRTKKLRIQFIEPTLYALKCEHNRYTVSYMFRHFFSAIMHHTCNIKKCWGWWMYTFLNTSNPGGTFRDLQSPMERMPVEMSEGSERTCMCMCVALTFFFHKRWGQTATCPNHLILIIWFCVAIVSVALKRDGMGTGYAVFIQCCGRIKVHFLLPLSFSCMEAELK